MSAPEEEFLFHCKLNGLEPEREFRFIQGRRFRADFYFPPNLLVEIDGGIWTSGRHTRGSGYEADCKKYNLAALAGFRTLRFTPGMVKSGEAIRDVLQALNANTLNRLER